LFLDSEQPDRDDIRSAMNELTEDYKDRSIEIKQVASGYRIQVKEDYSEWVSRLWTERPSRYSRALLETLSLMAYRQPITRGEIEDIRGVSVSTTIIKTLLEREWIKVVGYRDIPGKPGMYGTTKKFLDYFNLKSLDELPTLAELRDIDSINAELDFEMPGIPAVMNESQSVEEDEAEILQAESASIDELTEETESIDELPDETEKLEKQSTMGAEA
jgi:segregation and condensation protein B